MIIIEKKESPIEIEKKEIIIEMSQRGPSGPRGLKGDTGEQGPQGEKGDRGDPGPTTWDGITDKPDFGELSLKDKADYLTDIINAPALGELADHDTVDYDTEVTNKPELGAMAAEDDAPADSDEYVRKNGSWLKLTRNQTQWGGITGSLQNQLDLRIALSGKAAVDHTHGNVGSNGKVGGGSYVITNGDRMLISDASNDNSLVMSNVIFDGSSTDKALTKKGSFESFAVPSMLCSAEESMVATRNYTSGSLITVGKRLYSAVSNISSGSALTVGGNIVETTLEQQLVIKTDAPSNNKTYGRKNGDWVEVTGGGGGGASTWGDISGTLSDQTDLQVALDLKADISSLGALAAKDKADWSTDLTNVPSAFPPSAHNHDDRYYTENEVNALLSDKADADDVYTKTEVDTALSAKANSADIYTKTQTDNLLSAKANSADVYSKSDVDTALSAKANTADLGDLASKDTVDWDTDIDDIPLSFPPSSHTHTTSDITDFPTLGTMSAESTSDYYDKTDTDDLLNDKADIIHASASGSLVSISDGGAYPVTALSVGIEPVQDLHGYDHPWAGGSGANIYPNLTQGTYTNGGVTVTVGANNFITISGTKNTNNKVVIPLTYETQGITVAQGLYFHMHNSNHYNGLSFYIEDEETTPINLYDTDNRILENTGNRTLNACSITLRTSMPSGTEINMTMQPSLEATNAVTDFTPYSNVCPISGHTSATVTRTGKNLWNPTDIINANISTASPYNKMGLSNNTVSVYCKAKSGFTYTVSKSGGSRFICGFTKELPSSGVQVEVFNGMRDDSANSLTNTAPDGVNYFVAYVDSTSSGSSRVDLQSVQIEIGSSATEYEAPQIQTVTIDLNGTRYGGTLNILTGELTVTHAFITLDGSKVSLVGTASTGLLYASFEDVLDPTRLRYQDQDTISNLYIYHRANNANTTYGHYRIYTTNSANTIYIYDERLVDLPTAQNIYNATPIQISYSITPISVQLDSATLSPLLGENHIWASTGDVAVEYRADSKLYIDQKIAESQRATRSLITGIETEMVASKNYSSGDLVIVGDQLLKFTANTASGSTITVGSNVVVTTVAEQLLLFASA